MAKIKKFTPAILDNLSTDIDTTLASVSSKYGITMRLGRITYGDESFNAKISAAVAVEGVQDNEEAHYAVELSRSGWKYDLSKSDYGKKLTLNGRNMKFVGLRPGARTNAIIMRDMDNGKFYRFPSEPYVELIKKAKQ